MLKTKINCDPACSYTKQQGFSLIEVLVTMAIVIIGCLAVTAMMMTTLRYKQTSQGRQIAIAYNQMMVERMSANFEALDDYLSKEEDRKWENASYEKQQSKLGYKSCATSCEPQDIAKNDKRLWLSGLAQDLPNGRGVITEKDKQIVITVMWSEKAINEAVKQKIASGCGDLKVPEGTRCVISRISL